LKREKCGLDAVRVHVAANVDFILAPDSFMAHVAVLGRLEIVDS
jgi:hypothetical protein